jgi:hypothetical protein
LWICLVALCVFILACRAGWRWLDRYQGNSEEVYSQIRVGMSKAEVVSVLRRFDAGSGRYSFGVTTDGEQFNSFHTGLDDLPQAEEIEYAVLSALDSYGREIEVTLGPGGIVANKTLSPDVWEYRWHKLTRAIRNIPHSVTHSKYRNSILVLGGGLLLLLIVLVVRWAWRSLARRRAEMTSPAPLKSDSCLGPDA